MDLAQLMNIGRELTALLSVNIRRGGPDFIHPHAQHLAITQSHGWPYPFCMA
jgi:hypothetical protein